MTDRSLAQRIEQQVSEQAGQAVVVREESGGTLRLEGRVDSYEARQAVEDIASSVAPGQRIRNDLDVDDVLPPMLSAIENDGPTLELAESAGEIEAGGADLAPDFSDPLMSDPVEASGADSWGPEDRVSDSGETYSPPSDPVVGVDARGSVEVIGGFEDSAMDSIEVDRSTMDNQPGDEAIADAVRRELREDSATTDLPVHVEVRRGVVHLRGPVADVDDSTNVESVAWRVPGVVDVKDETDVAGG